MRLDRLARVLHVGQLDDDPVVAGAGQRRLGDAEGVDPAAEHLDRAVGRLGVGLDPIGELRLQRDLGAAAQVEAEPRLLGQGECGAAAEQTEHEQETEPGHRGTCGASSPSGYEAPKTSGTLVLGFETGLAAVLNRRQANVRTPPTCGKRDSNVLVATISAPLRCLDDGCCQPSTRSEARWR